MGTPAPPTGVVVTLDQIYDKVQATHDAVQPLVALPEVVASQGRRIQSLENWRLFLLGMTTASFGTAVVSLTQVPLLSK